MPFVKKGLYLYLENTFLSKCLISVQINCEKLNIIVITFRTAKLLHFFDFRKELRPFLFLIVSAAALL